MPADGNDDVNCLVLNAKPSEICLSLPPTPEAVRETLIQATEQLSDVGIHDDFRGTVETVLGEALNNIVEHAFAGMAPDPKRSDQIVLSLKVAAAKIAISISDSGRALPGDVLPEGVLPDLSDDIAALPEGGFGWFLIRELSDEVRYKRGDGLNRLDLTISDAQLPRKVQSRSGRRHHDF